MITRLNIGGPAQQAVGLSVGLTDLGWSTLLVTGRPEPGEGDMGYLLQGRAVNHVVLPNLRREIHPLRDLLAAGAIFKLLLQEKPEVLHTHTAKAGGVGRLAGLFYRLFTWRRLKVFHTFHGHVLEGYFSPIKTWLLGQAEVLLSSISSCLITLSQSLRNELAAKGIAPVSKIRVIPLGLPLTRLLALEVSNPSRIRHVGLIGRLAPIKNHPMLFEAVRLLQKNPKASGLRFLLYGDGQLRQELLALAQEKSIASQVQFKGWQRDVCAIYQELDLVCLTSRNEGTPVSLIEAMAAGRPIIATRVGGVHDLAGPPMGGSSPAAPAGVFLHERAILVASEDSASLASAIEWALSQPELLNQMIRAARAFAADRFQIERLIQEIDELYREP